MSLISVKDATYLKDYRIILIFSDGLKKIVDLEKELWGKIFEPLKDKELFKTFTLNPFTIEWSNGADFAPEFLYEIGEEIESIENTGS